MARQTSPYNNPLRRYRLPIVVVYSIGLVIMLIFNLNCYPGTFVGKFGWALIWPVSAPTFVFEFGFNSPGTLNCMLTFILWI